MIKATVNSSHSFEINKDQSNLFEVNGKNIPFELISADEYEWIVRNGNTQYKVLILESDHVLKKYTFKIKGKKFHVQLEDRLDILLSKMGIAADSEEEIRQMKAPMPGLILEIMSSKGMKVSKGEKILVLEAMKMENIIRSPSEGVIGDILIEIGDSVEKNQLLIQFE
jgi:acetyl/propionyl-CoA carboxylase alpha subunit